METIAIGCTRAGLALKKELVAHLEKRGFQVDDLGMKQDGEFVPYHKAAAAVAKGVSEGTYARGIIICGTGAGSVITAAKYKGVYPVHVTDQYTAEKARAVNNCNVVVFGEWLTPAQHAVTLLDTWLDTGFGQGFADEWKEFLGNCYNDIQQLESELMK
jgi:ribose 5-phosphate isomerase B